MKYVQTIFYSCNNFKNFIKNYKNKKYYSLYLITKKTIIYKDILTSKLK